MRARHWMGQLQHLSASNAALVTSPSELQIMQQLPTSL